MEIRRIRNSSTETLAGMLQMSIDLPGLASVLHILHSFISMMSFAFELNKKRKFRLQHLILSQKSRLIRIYIITEMVLRLCEMLSVD